MIPTSYHTDHPPHLAHRPQISAEHRAYNSTEQSANSFRFGDFTIGARFSSFIHSFKKISMNLIMIAHVLLCMEICYAKETALHRTVKMIITYIGNESARQQSALGVLLLRGGGCFEGRLKRSITIKTFPRHHLPASPRRSAIKSNLRRR